ncbi:MAG TPA: RT0821/Lpp0805 family surface protein [Alphaproteobacteria bacterium]|jgi:surface antigen|nr:RT0821/Lpp0805 family surface protein [Alphaproteobacteria bacterium]
MTTKLVVALSAAAIAAYAGLGAAPAAAACNNGWGTKEVVGTLGGAAIGGLIGNQFGKGTGRALATTGGVLVGGLIGNQIGKSMDCSDLQSANNTAQRSLESNKDGSSSSWSNPNSGYSGTSMPTRTWYNEKGQPCREFLQTVTYQGKTEQVTGVACRRNDGTWVTEQG